MTPVTPDSDSSRGEPVEQVPPRAGVYSFLGAAFNAPPSRDLFRCDGEDHLHAAESLGLQEAVAALRECARAAEDDEWLATARQEFMQLFKVPGRQYVAPYESVYRDSRDVDGKQVTGLLGGPSSVEVAKWYQLAALEVSSDFKDLSDHISLELAYMARLCQKEEELERAGDLARAKRAGEMQRDFLAGHLAAWVGSLSASIREKTQHPYFIGVTGLLVRFAENDLASLEKRFGPSSAQRLPSYGEVGV